MKNLKRLLAVLLAIAMVVALAGCGSSTDDTEEPSGNDEQGNETPDDTTPDDSEGGSEIDPSELNFYFVALMTGGAAWSRAEAGFNDACEELGVNGQYLAPVERNNSVEMAELLDRAVVQGADFIAGCWMSTDMFAPGLEKAREQGAVTASVQTTLDEEYIDFQIGTDQAKIGEAMADALAQVAGDAEVQVLFLCPSASEIVNDQLEAFEAALEQYPNITSLGMRFDEGQAATANQIISDEARANPGLNAVVCLDSSAATIGAASYVQENGLEDDWYVVGIDASADILNYVKDGALDCTLNQDFYAMGYESVMMAYELITKGTKPEFMNDTGTTLIMPEDVDTYAAENGIDLG